MQNSALRVLSLSFGSSNLGTVECRVSIFEIYYDLGKYPPEQYLGPFWMGSRDYTGHFSQLTILDKSFLRTSSNSSGSSRALKHSL